MCKPHFSQLLLPNSEVQITVMIFIPINTSWETIKNINDKRQSNLRYFLKFYLLVLKYSGITWMFPIIQDTYRESYQYKMKSELKMNYNRF